MRPRLTSDYGSLVTFIVGYALTVSAGILAYPIDTIRRRQMLTGESIVKAIQNQTSKHGWLSLWDGASTNVWRGMVGAATLASFDVAINSYINHI